MPCLVGYDRKSSVSDLLVINQPFLFLGPRVSVKAWSISSLLNTAESNNRRLLTIILYEAVDRGPVSLLEMGQQLQPGKAHNAWCTTHEVHGLKDGKVSNGRNGARMHVPSRLSELEWSQLQAKYFKRGRRCVPSWYGRWRCLVVGPLGVRHLFRRGYRWYIKRSDNCMRGRGEENDRGYCSNDGNNVRKTGTKQRRVGRATS